MRGRAVAPRPPPRRRARVFVAGCLAALGPVTPALAGVGERNGEIGADYALQRFDSDFEVGAGDRLSLRAGRHETRRLQWEGQVTRGSAEEEALPGATRKVTLTLALANGVLNFHPRRGVVPYVLAGIGLAKTKLEAVGLSSSDTWAGYQLAGGCRFFFRRAERRGPADRGVDPGQRRVRALLLPPLDRGRPDLSVGARAGLSGPSRDPDRLPAR